MTHGATFQAKPKDPDADLDYSISWSDWLQSGETISTSAWAVSPSGPTLHDGSNTTTAATTFMSGGSDGVDYILTNTITTDSTPARTDERSIRVPVRER